MKTDGRRKSTFMSPEEKRLLVAQLQVRIGGSQICADIALGSPVAWGGPPKKSRRSQCRDVIPHR